MRPPICVRDLGAVERERDVSLATPQSILGDDVFARLWAEGRAMTLEQAVAYALDEPPSA